jgi:hypothetical protein
VLADDDALVVGVELELSLVEGLESFDSFESLEADVFELDEPLVDDEDERESVMYQPLPLKTMPTGWITLRRVPPHCSHVVSGGSLKL